MAKCLDDTTPARTDEIRWMDAPRHFGSDNQPLFFFLLNLSSKEEEEEIGVFVFKNFYSTSYVQDRNETIRRHTRHKNRRTHPHCCRLSPEGVHCPSSAVQVPSGRLSSPPQDPPCTKGKAAGPYCPLANKDGQPLFAFPLPRSNQFGTTLVLSIIRRALSLPS